MHVFSYSLTSSVTINLDTVGGYRGNGRMLCHGCSKGARTRARKRITEEQVGKMEAWRHYWCSCLDWRSIAGYYRG